MLGGFAYLALLMGVAGFPLATYWKLILLFLGIFFILFAQKKWSNKQFIKAVFIFFVTITLKYFVPIHMIEEGGNVFVPESKIFKALPKPVYEYLDKSFRKLYPRHDLLPDNRLYAFSAEQIHEKGTLSRKRESVQFSSIHQLGFGAFNKNNYNTYKKRVPHRNVLPYFLRYEIPAALARNRATKVCWEGDLFYTNKYQNLIFSFAQTQKCLNVQDLYRDRDKTSYVFYGVNIIPKKPLKITIVLPWHQTIAIWIKIILSFMGAIALTRCFFSFESIKESWQIKEKRQKALILIFSVIVSSLVALLYRPDSLFGFILFEGGNDGLTHSTAARVILEALFREDWSSFFQGNESVYMLMPWHRYFYALNLLLFGETHLGYFLVILFFPLVIYRFIAAYFQSKKWAFMLSLIFVVVPIFESFGFAQFYMIRLLMRGFSEPLSYMFFFFSLSFGPYFLRGKEKKNLTTIFIVSLFSCFAVGIRPNVILGVGIYLLWISVLFLQRQQWKSVFILCLGFSPILLIPLHNYYFGNVFVLFAASAGLPENLAVLPGEYKAVFKSFISLSFPKVLLAKIGSHIKNEIPFTRFWLYVPIVFSSWGLFSKRISISTRMLCCVSISQLSVILFYNAGGRYSYIHWICLLLSFLLVIKEKSNRKYIGDR